MFKKFMGVSKSKSTSPPSLPPSLPPSPPPRPPPCPLLDRHWRSFDWTVKDELLKQVRNYKLDGASHVRILLYGPVGVGKSSFINAVGTIIVGRNVNVAAGNASHVDKSFTLQFKSHQFKYQEGDERQTIPIVFNDLMGLEANKNRGVQTEDIVLVMKGQVKEGYSFNCEHVMLEDNKYFNSTPTIDDKVHVVVCMLDANAIEVNASVLKKMKEVREQARDLGIPQVAVVSHIDIFCEETEKNIRDVFRSKVLKTKIELFSKTVGIPIEHTYPVNNSYEGEDRDAANTLILTALKNMLDFGYDFIDLNRKLS